MLAHPTMPNQTFPSSKWVQLVSGFHEPLEAKMKSLEAKIAEMQVLTGFDLLLDLLVNPLTQAENATWFPKCHQRIL